MENYRKRKYIHPANSPEPYVLTTDPIVKRIREIYRRKSLSFTADYRSISPFVARILSERLNRNYTAMDRGLNSISEELRLSLLPSLGQILIGAKKKKLRLLDAGAGHAKLGVDLEREYPNRKGAVPPMVEYHGVDSVGRVVKWVRYKAKSDGHILEAPIYLESELEELKSDPNVSDLEVRDMYVEKKDLTVDSLPRESYDVITSIFVLRYIPDKLKAIGNMVDALKPGGILLLNDPGIIDFVSLPRPLLTTDQVLLNLIITSNPHISLNWTAKGGLLITKLKSGRFFLPVTFVKAQLQDPAAFHQDLQSDLVGDSLRLTSFYRLNKKR